MITRQIYRAARPRLSYIRDISKLRFVRSIVTTFFIPTSHTREWAKASRPVGANTRAFYVWKRVLVTLRLPAEKVSANDAFTRLRRVCTAVCNERILAPIPIHMSVQPDTDAHTCASESRPRRQVPFTHTLARKQIPGLSRIYWNNLGKYDKFGYEICRRACELSAPVSASLPRSLPPSSPPLSASSPFLSYPFKPHAAPLPIRPPRYHLHHRYPASRISPTHLEWYLLKIGSIATWIFACSSYTFRLPRRIMYTCEYSCSCSRSRVYVCACVHASSSPQTARILQLCVAKSMWKVVGYPSHEMSDDISRRNWNRFHIIRNCLASLKAIYV